MRQRKRESRKEHEIVGKEEAQEEKEEV